MARTISQYQTAPFTTPQNGQPADATQVLGNDNTVRTSINSHDADSGIHFQSSTLAARPIAGTAGRKWFTEDTYKLFYDDGSAWQEVGYLPVAGGTVTGNLLFSADNTKDIGAVGATRPRTGYFGTSLIVPLVQGASGLTLEGVGASSVGFTTNSTSRWSINSSGHLNPAADNTYDIGTSGGPRVRTIYAQTSVSAPQFVATTSVTAPTVQADTQVVTTNNLNLNSSGSNGIALQTGNTTRWQVSNAGHLTCFADNTYDIGASGAANRPRTVYVANDLQIGVGGAQLTTNSVKIGGVQVVGGRQTSWTNMTGTANQSTSYDTSTITLVQLAQRVWAIQQALTNAGTIGP